MTTDSFFKSKGFEILSDIRIDQDSCSAIASHLTSTNFVSHSSNYIEFQPGSRRHGDSVIFFLPDAAPGVIDALPLQAISETVLMIFFIDLMGFGARYALTRHALVLMSARYGHET